MVITRYVIHHFPDIQHSIDEVSRVLKNKGCFFISDPCPNECDTSRFVDEYMQLRKDGHIKFSKQLLTVMNWLKRIQKSTLRNR